MLAQGRIDRLISIGFKWALVVKGPLVPWETRFEELVQYKAKHGHCDEPQKQGKLGTWAVKQRHLYLAGSLAQDRICALDSIGFGWTLDGVLKEAWKSRFRELVQYKAEHGDCDVPLRQGKLGQWVNTQRTFYRRKKLTSEQINRLGSIGFKWKMDKNLLWETRFNEVVKYKASTVIAWFQPGRGSLEFGSLHKELSKKGEALKRKRLLKQLLAVKEKVSPLSKKVESLCTGQKAIVVGPDRVKGEGFDSEPLLTLHIPSKSNDNSGSMSDDEVDEIGALIYEQAMRNKGEIK